MFDVDLGISWTYFVLKQGGMFYMDNYVGYKHITLKKC